MSKTVKTHEVKGFSNGTEYEIFLEKNCYQCKHYIEWTEATPENPECRTEAAIAEADWDISRWPKGKIKMNQDLESGNFYIPHCLDFKGVSENAVQL